MVTVLAFHHELHPQQQLHQRLTAASAAVCTPRDPDRMISNVYYIFDFNRALHSLRSVLMPNSTPLGLTSFAVSLLLVRCMANGSGGIWCLLSNCLCRE